MSLKTLHLEVLHGGEVVEARSFTKSMIRIGRLAEVKGEANDIVLNVSAVSGQHARIRFEGGSVTVIDSSRNGTFVNGELLRKPRQLVLGEEIKIGAFTVRWRVEGEEREEVIDIAPEDVEDVVGLDGRGEVAIPEDPMLPDFRSLGQVPASNFTSKGPVAPEEERRLAPGESRPRELLPTGPLPVIPQGGDGRGLGEPVWEPRREVLGRREEVREREPEVEHHAQRAPTSELAAAYRVLARQFKAPGWGRPPRVDASKLAHVRDAAQEALGASALDDAPLWTNWLAHEICGLDPIQALLDDSRVVGIVVQGEEAVRVLRGSSWEVASRRFSCVEAVFASVERWTDRRLKEGSIECTREGLTIRAFSGEIVPLGPVIAIQRHSLGGGAGAGASVEDLVALQVLPLAAAELLSGALAASASILIYCDAFVEPSILLQALWAGLPEEVVGVVIGRASPWSPKRALVVDGRTASPEDVWRCVKSISPHWLFIEEVGLADAIPLCTHARHRGGGTVATVRAQGGAAALGRLTASLAASLGSSASACRAAVAGSFDLVVGVTSRASGLPRLTSIAEVRGGGELAELFAWHSATSTLEKTGIEPAILGGEE